MLRGAVLALFAADKLAADGCAPVEPRQGGIRLTPGIVVGRRDAVDQMAELVRQSDGRLTKEPIDAEKTGAGHSTNFADPEDNYWEIAWAPGDNAIVAAARRAAGIER